MDTTEQALLLMKLPIGKNPEWKLNSELKLLNLKLAKKVEEK